MKQNKISEEFIQKKIIKLSELAAENQRLKDYLNHIEVAFNPLRLYMDKIESFKLYQKAIKLELLFKKFIYRYQQIKLADEFEKWNNTRNTKNFDVIIFGVIKYDFRNQRPQQLANELSKRSHRVFYVDPDFKFTTSTDTQLEPLIQKIKPNLYTIKLATSRKEVRKRFVYYGAIEDLDIPDIVNSLQQLIQKAHLNNAIIKVDNPTWFPIINELDLPVVYDCFDDHAAFEVKADNIESIEKSTINKCDAVLACSEIHAEKIKNKYHTLKPKVLENAGEYKHFAKMSHNSFVPKDIESIHGPILGYCGALCEWFDVRLLEYIAQTFTQYSIVLIGNPDYQPIKEVAQRYQNIYLLGEKKYQVIPAYYNKFNVCLIPFLVNGVTRALNPVKLYEYLAMGKPVVTTNNPGLKQFAKYIYISKNNEEFCQNIKKALLEKKSKLSEKRKQFSKNNTWEIRAIQLEKIMQNVLTKNL